MSGGEKSAGDIMAAKRTALAFQRTRLAADRTLMASLRTALSLIGFGFTIFSFFRTLAKPDALGNAIPDGAPARFGLALVVLGVITLSLGIWSDMVFDRSLRAQRDALIRDGLLANDDNWPKSVSLVSAYLLLLLGVFAILSITLRVGPFQ